MTYYRIDHAIKEFANDLADHFKNEAESWNTQKEFYEDTPAGKEKRLMINTMTGAIGWSSIRAMCLTL